MDSLAKIAPLAVVMVAGPQIVSAIMLAVSEKARKNSLAYVGGAVLAATLATAVFYAVATALHEKAKAGGNTSLTIDYIFVGLLLLLAIRVFLKRKETQPPKWMAKLQMAQPRFAFGLGFLLFLVMPTDVITTLTVGSFLATHGSPLTDAVPFLLLTALLVASPLIILLALGKKGQTLLPKMRDWMNSHSWIVSEAVIGLFLVLQVQTILSD